MKLIQKYCFLFVAIKSIVVLSNQNVFAKPSCPSALLNDSQIESDVTNITFQESISILTDVEKLQILSDLNIEESKRDAIIRIGIIRDTQTQNKRLKDVIGLNDHTIDTIRSRGILQIHPIEYQKFTTMPPANPVHIRPRAIISAVNENGYLQNAIIEIVGSENIYIRFDDTKKFSVISRNDIYQPILLGRQVYYSDENGIPKIYYIDYRNSEEAHQYPLKDSDKNNAQKRPSSLDELHLKPRKEIATSKKDYSKKITFRSIISISHLYMKLIRKYSLLNNINKDIIKLNNDLLSKLSIEMRKAGIITSLLPSDINLKDGEIIYDPFIMNLSIDGVHENGNISMRRYMKIAEKLNASSIEIFPLIEVIAESSGRADETINRILLNIDSVIHVLLKGRSKTISHELTHSYLQHMTNTGFYKTSFTASDTSKLNDSGIYHEVLSLSELYTHTSDLLSASKALLKLQKRPIMKFLHSRGIYREMKDILYIIQVINETIQTIVSDVLQRPHLYQRDISYYLEDKIEYRDSENRLIRMATPHQDIEDILNSPLSLSLPIDVQQLIEDIRQNMTSLVPSDINLAQSYIEFLENDPTVIEFLEEKKRLGYYYDSAHQRRRSLHFKRFIGDKITGIKEKIYLLMQQQLENRLKRIKSLSEQVSDQLNIIEHYIQSDDLMDALKMNDRKGLKKLTRKIKKLQLMLYREI